jgi:hypothetical protein
MTDSNERQVKRHAKGQSSAAFSKYVFTDPNRLLSFVEVLKCTNLTCLTVSQEGKCRTKAPVGYLALLIRRNSFTVSFGWCRTPNVDSS